jgi:hypothetical protein
LRSPQIKALVEQGALQFSLFNEQDLVEITHLDHSGERLMCCCNPALAKEWARKREELLLATEAEFDKIVAATRRARRGLRGSEVIALCVGQMLNSRRVGKHFVVEIGEDSLTFRRDEDKIASEAALDGVYVICSCLPARRLGGDEVVPDYKGLEEVERFFRGMNGKLELRPIRLRLAERVPAHALHCTSMTTTRQMPLLSARAPSPRHCAPTGPSRSPLESATTAARDYVTEKTKKSGIP